MNSLNSLVIEGDVTKITNFEFKYEFEVEVKRVYNTLSGETKEEVSKFTVIPYGNLATVCENKLEIGQGIRLCGRLFQDKYLTCGKQRSRIVIIAEHIDFKGVNNG